MYVKQIYSQVKRARGEQSGAAWDQRVGDYGPACWHAPWEVGVLMWLDNYLIIFNDVIISKFYSNQFVFISTHTEFLLRWILFFKICKSHFWLDAYTFIPYPGCTAKLICSTSVWPRSVNSTRTRKWRTRRLRVLCIHLLTNCVLNAL